MRWLAIADASALDAINLTQPDKKISPIVGAMGGLLVCDDLLSDCGDGQTWAAYREFLMSLATTDEQPKAPERLAPGE